MRKLPVHESPLGEHEVELPVEAGPGRLDGRRVGQAADGPGHLGQVASGHDSRRLVVDAHLKSCRVFNLRDENVCKGKTVLPIVGSSKQHNCF